MIDNLSPRFREQITLPVISTIRRDGDGLIEDYRTYFDAAPL